MSSLSTKNRVEDTVDTAARMMTAKSGMEKNGDNSNYDLTNKEKDQGIGENGRQVRLNHVFNFCTNW